MKKITYYLLYGLVYSLSLLPFRLLFLLSDGLFLLVFHVIRYRRKIVWKNLSSSFPEKDERELRQTERQFYHWFCDYIFETFKLLSMSHKKMLRHIEFRGVEELEKCYDEGQNCAAILGHYCNWEWLSASGLAFRRYPQPSTSSSLTSALPKEAPVSRRRTSCATSSNVSANSGTTSSAISATRPLAG